MNATRRLGLSLLGLRLTVFLVMLMWTLDKFIRPQHAAGVFEHFYALGGLGAVVFVILGVLELLLLLAFSLGRGAPFQLWRRAAVARGFHLVVVAPVSASARGCRPAVLCGVADVGGVPGAVFAARL